MTGTITLKELIEGIEKIQLHYNEEEEKTVEFDFGTAIPSTLDSWRGIYSSLALGYELSGYDSEDNHHKQVKVSDLLKELKSAIGKEYTGWVENHYYNRLFRSLN